LINFNHKDKLQICSIKANELIKWSESELKELTGYYFKVWCNPQMGRNILNFNIDETEMTEDQWEVFCKEFDSYNGYSDYNLVKLLKRVFGESEYTFKVHELEELYIIRHDKKE
jgi:hypothetical protein